jgi:dethiobiotin synthetase
MTALFVTATGTDVGKTYVTRAMIYALRARGRPVRALKPVATGFDERRPRDSDAGRLLAALDAPNDAASLDEISPWRFAAPLSPDMAAARDGRAIEWLELIAYCRRRIEAADKDGAVLLIEGIGGAMVPLDERRTVLDWIAALDVPTLLVAGSYLGTLSHTLTAAGMLASRRCRLAGIVVNTSVEEPVPAEETAATLGRFLAPVPITVLPRASDIAALAAAERLVALLDSL